MSGASTSLPILLEHFENALPQTCRDMGVEIRVGTLVIGVDGPLRRAIGFASTSGSAAGVSLGERGTALRRTVPIAVRYRVAGAAEWLRAHCVVSGARRPPPHAELALFAPVSRPSDRGIPVAFPLAVAAAIQSGA
jgi:hypothetical protein